MRIGIFETGKLVPEIAARHGDYTALFRALLGPHAPEAEFLTVPVVDGEMPHDVTAVDGWIITGSRHGVYDDLPWIPPFREVLRACRDRGVPMAGICFGHQIMAEALGGRAEKAAQGWGLGVDRYEVTRRPDWMDGAGDSFAGLAMHQDQVTVLPPQTTVLARSAFCPYAALAYGEPEDPWAISVQSHPEFTPPLLADLIGLRRGVAIPDPVAEQALRSLSRPVGGADWARWIVRLFRRPR